MDNIWTKNDDKMTISTRKTTTVSAAIIAIMILDDTININIRTHYYYLINAHLIRNVYNNIKEHDVREALLLRR
jgi:hypothetical protein